MDTNVKSRKIKFNIIDFVIALAVLTVILVVALRGGLVKRFTEAKDIIQYTVKITDIQMESFDLIEVGSKIYCNDDDSCLGVIKSKSYQPASMYTVLSNGEIVKTSQPGRIDVFLTIEAEGTVDEEGCRINGTYFIACGKNVSSYVDKLYFNFEVTEAFEKV